MENLIQTILKLISNLDLLLDSIDHVHHLDIDRKQLQVSNDIVKVLDILDMIPSRANIPESFRTEIVTKAEAIRLRRHILYDSYASIPQYLNRTKDIFSINVHLFHLECRLNVMVNEKIWLHRLQSCTSKNRECLHKYENIITTVKRIYRSIGWNEYKNIECSLKTLFVSDINPDTTNEACTQIENEPFILWRLSDIYSFLILLCEVWKHINCHPEEINCIKHILDCLFNRFSILACYPEDVSNFVMPGSTDMKKIIQEINTIAPIDINEYDSLFSETTLDRQNKTVVQNVIELLSQYDKEFCKYTIENSLIYIGTRSLIDILSPSLNMPEFTILKGEKIQITLDACWDMHLLFDTMWKHIAMYQHTVNVVYSNVPTSFHFNASKWIESNIIIAQGDDFANIFKKYLISFFEPIIIRDIFQRISPGSDDESSEKKIQAVLNNGSDFIRELYIIGDTPLSDIQSSNYTRPFVLEVLHRAILKYVIKRRLLLDFDTQIMISVESLHSSGDKTYPRIFKIPLQHSYCIITQNSTYVNKVKTITEAFILWLVLLYNSFSKTDIYGIETTIIQNPETNEDINVFPLIKDVLGIKV